MPNDDAYKPIDLRNFHAMTSAEREAEFLLIKEQAKREGRSGSEVFRIAMMRQRFVGVGRGDLYEEELAKSRKQGEPFMGFIKRMNRTYLAH